MASTANSRQGDNRQAGRKIAIENQVYQGRQDDRMGMLMFITFQETRDGWFSFQDG